MGHAAAAVVYVSLTLVLCRGITAHPFTRTFTLLGDGFLTFWDFWWTHKALVELHTSPFRTAWLTYPHEISLVFHVLDVLDGVLILPLQFFWSGMDGVVLGVNATACLSFTLSALAAYAAALLMTDAWLPSLVAGLGYGFSAFHVSRADVPVTAALYWLPLFTLVVLRAVRKGGWPRIAGAGGCFVLCTFQSAYYSLLLVLLAPFLALAALLDTSDRRLALGRLTGVGLAIVIGAAPMLMLAGIDLRRQPYTTTGVSVREAVSVDADCRNSVDLLGLIVPGPAQGLWSRYAVPWNRYLTRPTCGLQLWGGNGEGGTAAYVGLAPLGLAIFALARGSRRRTLPWALGALFFGTLALGPNLHAGGTILRRRWLPLPYRLLFLLPSSAHTMFHMPYYLWPGALFALWVLAAQGLALVMRTCRSPRRRWLTYAALLLWLVADYASPPLATWDIPRAPVWTTIAADPRPAVVIDLPATNWVRLEYFSFLQTIHGKPITRGFVSRFDAWTSRRDALLRRAEISPLALRALLRETGPAYVVLHRGFTESSPARTAAIETMLAPLETYADAQVTVYRWPSR